MHAHCSFFRYAATKSYRQRFFILSASGNFAQVHWVVVLVSAPFSSAAETSWVCLKKSRWGSFGGAA